MVGKGGPGLAGAGKRAAGRINRDVGNVPGALSGVGRQVATVISVVLAVCCPLGTHAKKKVQCDPSAAAIVVYICSHVQERQHDM